MSWADLINGAFELSGGFFIWLSVRRTLRDKYVAGVDWMTTAFFAAWGWWNLYFYPSLDQWASFAGGVFIVIMNTTWVVLLIYYSRNPKRSQTRTHEL